MSAFIVTSEHIDAMISLGLYGPADQHANAGGVSPDSVWSRLSYYTRDLDGLTMSEMSDAHVTLGDPGGSPNSVGAMLWRANVESVAHRYSESDHLDSLPGPVPTPDPNEYSFGRLGTRQPTAVEGLKLISGFEYQSCEHPEWRGSEAQRFCDALRHALIHRLRGYNDAPWEWTAESVLASR